MDYKLNGPADAVAALVFLKDGKTPRKGFQVIGPRTLDGLSYVNVRTDNNLTVPKGIQATSPELSSALIGDWYEPPTEAELQAMKAAMGEPTATPEEPKEEVPSKA